MYANLFIECEREELKIDHVFKNPVIFSTLKKADLCHQFQISILLVYILRSPQPS